MLGPAIGVSGLPTRLDIGTLTHALVSRLVGLDAAAELLRFLAAGRQREGGAQQSAQGQQALLAGDGDVVADIFRTRVVQRGKGAEVWGWGTAYGSKPAKPQGDAS